MNIKETLIQELNKSEKIEKNKDYSNLILHTLAKLLVRQEHHQFVTLLLKNNVNVLEDLSFYELFEDRDTETNKEYLNDEFNFNTRTSLAIMAIQSGDELFQNIIFSKMNTKDLLNPEQKKHDDLFKYIIYRDDRKSFLNLITNLKENSEYCYEKAIAITMRKILYDTYDKTKPSIYKAKESFFNWLINLDITPKAINNYPTIIFDSVNILITHDDYINRVIDKMDSNIFSNQFNTALKDYIDDKKHFFPNYYERENSHILFPFLIKNNMLKDIDEKLENFLTKRYKTTLNRMTNKEKENLPKELEIYKKSSLAP